MPPAETAPAAGPIPPAAKDHGAAPDHAELANALRALAMDAVETAKSGHPGLPMGCADIATVLFTRFLKFDAGTPDWPDRDRFVLSAGHGSMLLYAALHLLGYEGMTLDELRRFRQLGSLTPGHPEHWHPPGVETTTGPLGQGLGNAVGMAIAERHLAAEFGDEIVDHRTFVIASDGDLMEGVSHEAISLAGHLKLARLIVLFDDNGITIDGSLELAESGSQPERFAAAGWAVQRIDGHDPDAIAGALERAVAEDAPSLIACKTRIGYGSPGKEGTAAAHGSPLGPEEYAAARKALGIAYEPFEVPAEIRDAWRIAGLRGRKERKAWQDRLAEIDPERRAEFERRRRGDLPEALAPAIGELKGRLAGAPVPAATRKASQDVLEVVNAVLPDTVGGSADLTGSNNTRSEGLELLTAENYGGRYIHYGVREHGMAAAMNGMALHGGVIPYGGTFLVFSDYCRPAIRLAALMGRRVIFVFSHDSIGLGEDGPTHQPVEHLAALRAMPNLAVFRPADAVETAECWLAALERSEGPSVLALTRQSVEPVRRGAEDRNLAALGAYELATGDGGAEVSLFASGSEVAVAMAAHATLAAKGVSSRVVSVPCFKLFEARVPKDREDIIGTAPVKVAIEAAVEQGWRRFIGEDGIFIGMTGFGASAPYKDLYEHFGITAEHVVAAVERRLAGKS